jgi:hypothetical protein
MKKTYKLIIFSSLFINLLAQYSVFCQTLNYNFNSPPILPTSIIQKFAVIGDYGLSGAHEAAVANLAKSWNPDFIITVGDNNYVNGDSTTIDANIGQYYHDFINPYSGNYGEGSTFNRFFPALGDHDLNTKNGAAYLQYFALPGNERYYDYIKGNIHFFVLNSDPREADGVSSNSIQALWLKNKLQNSTSLWNVVYFHHSPYCSDIVGSKTYMQWPFKLWGAHVVLSGHSHVFERLIVDDIPYFVVGVGGEGLTSFQSTPLPESRFRYNSDYGAMLCTEYSDNLTFQFYNRVGTLMDSYLLTKSQGILCTASGAITRDFWANITGTSVANIPVNNSPTSTSQLNVFEGPSKAGDNYASRIRGYICPPLTGNYIFWIASDDNSELWLSTNDNPANKVKIASVSGYTSSRQWTKYTSQQSRPISLTAGLKYYIEALHKEGSLGDNLAVGWQIPNGTLERPIPGNRLSLFDTIIPQPSNELISAGSNWKYLDNGTDQDTLWRNNSYNDSSWLSGNSELGYGDGGEATIVSYGPSSTNKYITTYFRKKINIPDLTGITGLELSLIRDDGAVVFVNGKEVYRNNMPSDTINFETFASLDIDGLSESTYVIATISSNSLVVGENIIAVEIHQQDSTSSDISFNFKLKKLTAAPSANYTQNVFAIIGDYGWTGPNEAAVANLVKSWNPEYIITTGDNNYRDGADSTIDANIGQYYHNYIKPYNGIYGPGADINRFFPSLGNHDMITSSGAAYLAYFNLFGNERYYDFVKGDIHFFVLNGNPEEVDGITSTSVQANWLKNKLAASTAKWKLVYFHQSPFVSDIVHGNTAEMQWPFKTWGADALISGHSHVYERIVIDNFNYFVNGLGGESKYSFSPSPISGSQIRYNANFGAIQVTVKPDTLWFKFYDVSNNLIESYPLVKSATQPPVICEAKITVGGPTTFCAGGNVTLFANTGFGFTYQWKKNGVNISGATASSYVASQTGDYQIKISFTGCTVWSALTKVTINSSLVAKITPGSATTFCNGGNVILYANTCSGYIYQWKKNGANISGATSATYTANSSGDYQVKIIQGSSVSWSALTKVTVTICTRGSDNVVLQNDSTNSTLQDANDTFNVNVYPNPTTGLFSFELSIEDIPEGPLLIKVVNSLGQPVYTKTAEHISGSIKETIDLSSSLPAGIYILQLTIGNKTENTQILLTR